MKKLLITALSLLTLCACIPWQPLGTDAAARERQQQCPQLFARLDEGTGEGLSGVIELVNWNLQKGNRDGWQAKLQTLGRQHDLVLIQEALDADNLFRPLALHRHRHFAPGYHTGSVQTGVLTASRVAPLARCNLSAIEPWLGTPKATAITRFRLKDSSQTLLVANIHSVNFSFGIGEYRDQLQQAVAVLARHRGPIIFAGDFNTWNQRRLTLLTEAAEQLSLSKVSFSEDRRKRFLGRPLDHILVRGLEPLAGSTPQTDTSDHNPLLVSLSRPVGVAPANYQISALVPATLAQ